MIGEKFNEYMIKVHTSDKREYLSLSLMDFFESSWGVIGMLIDIEDIFDIEIKDVEACELETFEDLFKIIEQKLKEKDENNTEIR